MTVDFSLGPGGAARFSGQRGRLSDGANKNTLRYPSPFFDIGHTYLPPSMKALLRWCRYYYLVNPLINTVIHKMAEYPITEIVIDEKDPEVKAKWEDLIGKHLRYRAFQIEAGLDYYTYGICAVTLHLPFTKYLVCTNCKTKYKAQKVFYRWRNLDYYITCEKCGHDGAAKVEDFFERDVRRIRLQRWNPENLNVEPGFAGADPVYTFDIPLTLRNDILIGKKAVLDTIPDTFIEAMKRNKTIRFADDNLFILKRPIISQKEEGWGMPMILPVLKDSYYLQVLRKAQEAIAQEHIVPLRVLFPQAGSGSSDPYTTVSLDSWKSRMENEIAKWKYDNNYIPILPLPIGTQTIGGDGKALGLYQEMEMWSQHIVSGMGVPQELVFGGLTYSGSNVSLRMLENMFIGYRIDHDNMLNQFVIRRIAHFMGWPVTSAHMRRFKMADDLQRTAFLFQLNQAQKLSDETLLQEADQDPVVEKQRREGELEQQLSFQKKMQLAQAATQGEASLVQMEFQIKGQQKMQEAMPQPAVGADGQPVQPGAEGAPGQEGAQPGAAPGGDPAQGGQPQTGAEGEMVPGQQADPNMPADSTISLENAQQPPAEGAGGAMSSPLTMGTKGGGFNLLYLAKRAAEELRKMDEATKMGELNKMKMGSPQLYMIVIDILRRDKGAQENPLNPAQSPLPQMKPTRRAAPVG